MNGQSGGDISGEVGDGKNTGGRVSSKGNDGAGGGTGHPTKVNGRVFTRDGAVYTLILRPVDGMKLCDVSLEGEGDNNQKIDLSIKEAWYKESRDSLIVNGNKIERVKLIPESTTPTVLQFRLLDKGKFSVTMTTGSLS